jgi:hypothetical protein
LYYWAAFGRKNKGFAKIATILKVWLLDILSLARRLYICRQFKQSTVLIPSKALQDLEFPTVLQQLVAQCNTELGKEHALEIKFISGSEEILLALGQISVYLPSLGSENRIPNHGFDRMESVLALLRIENTTLEISSFYKI